MHKTIIGGFSPLKIQNFRTYMFGQAISLIGTWLQGTAQAWVVWDITHSEASLGIVAMLGALPLLFLGPWAGVLADRYNRRKLLMITQVGMMLLAFILAFLVQSKLIQLWHIYILSLFLGLFSAIDFPTQSAFLGDLAGMSEVRKAVNMNAMFFQASRMIGPALAGYIIGQWGSATAFWLNGLSFIAVIYTIVIVRSHQVKRPANNNSVLSDLAEGFRFIRTQPRIQDLLLMSISITALALSLMTMMPSFAAERIQGNANTLGLLLASSGAGALVSVIFISPVAQSKRRVGYVMALAIIWAGFWIIGLSLAKTLPLAMLSLFLLSFSLPLVIAMSLGLIQILAPHDMRARLLSLFTMVSFGLQPISSIIVGNLSEKLGVATVATINGIALILVATSMLFLRKGLKEWSVNKEHNVVIATPEHL